MTIAVSFNWGNVAAWLLRYPALRSHMDPCDQFWLEVVELGPAAALL